MALTRRALLLAAPAVALAACTGLADAGALDPTAPGTDLRVLVPTSVGGGFDTTARVLAAALQDVGAVDAVDVVTLTGGGGAAAVARLVGERGNPDLVLAMGLGVVGALRTGSARVGLAGTTPVARLITEPSALLVRAGSPLADAADLVAALRSDPAAEPVGGGSALGGPDHLLTLELGELVGARPRYVAYDGGGAVLPALLRGDVAVVASGAGEHADQIAAGTVRVLATTGDERQAGVDAPTLREQGVALTFTNWRGLLAPPGLAAAQLDRLVDLVAQVRTSPTWTAALARYGWTDAPLAGPDLTTFVAEQDRATADLLARLTPT